MYNFIYYGILIIRIQIPVRSEDKMAIWREIHEKMYNEI